MRRPGHERSPVQSAHLHSAEQKLAISTRARLTVNEAAALEGIHPETLRRLARAGRIGHKGGGTRGRRLTFTLADLGRESKSPARRG